MNRFERWSRRKLGEDVEEALDREPLEKVGDGELIGDTPGDGSQGSNAPGHATDVPEPVAPGSLDHTLPDPDELSAGADFSAYLQQGVSRQLRRRALRRLWSAGNYGVRDGLDDYDEDYREVLKPLSQDIAEQLRRWTQPSEQSSSALASEDDEAVTETTRPCETQPEHDASSEKAASSDETPLCEVAEENRLDEKTMGSDNKFS